MKEVLTYLWQKLIHHSLKSMYNIVSLTGLNLTLDTRLFLTLNNKREEF